MKFVNRLFGSDGECYYINSNNILPPPLSEIEEEKCLLDFKNGDIEARNKLITHNLRLVVYIAKKFESTKINIEDLISIGSMGLIKAVQTFKLEKNIKLATYASRCIENEILMHLRKVSKQKQEVSLFEPLNTDSEGNELCISDVLSGENDEVSKNLDREDEFSNLTYVLDNLSKYQQNTSSNCSCGMLLQPMNAPYSIVFTLTGIITLVSDSELQNANSSIMVTLSPSSNSLSCNTSSG